MVKRLKRRWNIDSNSQLLLILIVFALTGMTTLWVRKAIWPYLGLSPETSFFVKAPLYILIIFPIYQILQLIIALIFGQFRFFWEFEKKMFRRLGLIPAKKAIIISGFTFLTLHAMATEQKTETATLGGGCFWCTEAVFLGLKGVIEVSPGYSGGHIKNPAYREVVTGRTGHAEVIQVRYNPAVVSFSEILEIFFMTHDPTTLNRQGADVGTQYRSAIFYHSEEQEKIAREVISLFEKEKVYDNPIVTEVTRFSNFYKAEDYHKNYFARNPDQPYCQFVVAPKVDKFRKIFQDKLK